MKGEDLLDTDSARCNLADDKGGIIFGVDGDDYSFKNLDTRLVPFLDTLMDGDSVSDVESNFFVSSLIGHVRNYNREIEFGQ